jgi:hypothetical protein
MVNFARVAWQVDRHVVVYDANFRRCDGEQCFYGVIKDNYGPAKLLAASDRAWLGRPQPPPARAMWRSLFPSAAKGRSRQRMAVRAAGDVMRVRLERCASVPCAPPGAVAWRE